jgi:hypothetical protein
MYTERVTSSFPDAQPVAADPIAPAHSDSDGTVDLYGNEVIDAVATYSLDPTGSLYELHSPQTELPRLASPKS